MTKLSLRLSILAVLVLSWDLADAEDLKIGFDERGLASIIHNGVELSKPEDRRFRLQELYFVDA